MTRALVAVPFAFAVVAHAGACLPDTIACDPHRGASTCPAGLACVDGACADPRAALPGAGEDAPVVTRTALPWTPDCCGLERTPLASYRMAIIDGVVHLPMRDDELVVHDRVLDGDDLVDEALDLPRTESEPLVFQRDGFGVGPMCIGAHLASGTKMYATCRAGAAWAARPPLLLLTPPDPFQSIVAGKDGTNALASCNGDFTVQRFDAVDAADVEVFGNSARGCGIARDADGLRMVVVSGFTGASSYVREHADGTWTSDQLSIETNDANTGVVVAPDGRVAVAFANGVTISTTAAFPDGERYEDPMPIERIATLFVADGAWLVIDPQDDDARLAFLPRGAVTATIEHTLVGVADVMFALLLDDGETIVVNGATEDAELLLLRGAPQR